MRKTGTYLREGHCFKYPLSMEKGQGDIDLDQLLRAMWRHPEAVLALERYCRGYDKALPKNARATLVMDGLMGFDGSVHPAVVDKLLKIIPPEYHVFTARKNSNPRK